MTDPDLDKLRELTEKREKHVKSCEDNGDGSHRIIADNYSDPAHFIYELIQNADDAQATKIHFDIEGEEIRVFHNGRDFEIKDIESITQVNNSTKEDEEDKIGKFGIGFKSVFNITTKPKIHSGKFNFEIEDYIIPRELEAQKNDGTIFVLPLDKEIPAPEIIEKISQFAQESLLFLNYIEEIKFSLAGKDQTYRVKELPSSRKSISSQDGETTYLFFKEGKVKIAYQIERKEEKEKIVSKESAKIFVFFPVNKESAHFGFLAHAPYQTTPSRETIDFTKEKNQMLTQSLTELFCQSLKTIKQEGFLTAEFFNLLPLGIEPDDSFDPAVSIREKFLEEIQNKPLLPKHRVGYVKAGEARLGSEGLRKLFSSAQLGAIHGQDKIEWISGEITQDRTEELHSRLKGIGVQELNWDAVLPKLTKDFLEKQNDDWIRKLYEALNEQQGYAVRDKMSDVPLIRLESGKHIELAEETIFLPLKDKDTHFHTVRRAVCNTDDSQKFLKDLGMRLPERVDDVMKNILPKYISSDNNISELDYKKDISDILYAYATDSNDQKEELKKNLKKAYFVKAIDFNSNSERMARPNEVYIPRKILKGLFLHIGDILFVNDYYPSLKGEKIGDLLSVCGATDTLRLEKIENPGWISKERLKERLYEMSGITRGGGFSGVVDWIIPDLEKILAKLPNLSRDERCQKAERLWTVLSRLKDNELLVQCIWSSNSASVPINLPARFINQLKESAWIPDGDGELKKPEDIKFSSTGWQPENDELAKLLGMFVVETMPVEEHQEKMAEKDKEIAELREELTSHHLRQEREASPQSQNWEPAVDPDQAEPQIFKVESYSPQENAASQSRASASSNSSSTTQRDEDDGEQRPSPEESKKIGKWGEAVVYKKLCDEYGLENVTWYNEEGESTNSHDFTIKGESGDIFVEVKSTKEEKLPHRFDFSAKQFQEMEDNRENYIIYAVFDCGTKTPRIAEIKSPSGPLTPSKYVLEITEQDLLRSESLDGSLVSADE